MAQSQPMMDATNQTARDRRMDRIHHLSRLMAVGCIANSALLIGAMLFYWITTPARTLFTQVGLPGVAVAEIDLLVRALAFAISMIPLGALIYGLANARLCFDAFAAGRIFSIETIGWLKAFSIGVAASALLKPFAGAALSVLLSWQGMAGPKTLALNIGSDTLIALIFAGMVAVIAWVMIEAIEISDENKQFV